MADKTTLVTKARFVLKNIAAARDAAAVAHEIRNDLAALVLDGGISEGEFYEIISVLTPQSRSSLCQNYYILKNGCRKIPATDDRGDFADGKGKYAEYKASGPNRDGVLHIVQIRPWQRVDYYIVQKITSGKVFTFRLTKKQMEKELALCGASSAHGTRAAVANNKNREWRMTIPPDGEHWRRWCERYRINA